MNYLEFKRPESVLVLIYAKDADVLLLRRQHPPDFWQSVTGSLEWGEAPLTAAQRELREETGLDANAGLIDCAHRNIFEILPAWRHRYAPGTTRNIEHVYRIEYPQPPEIQLNHMEHKEFVWLPREQALRRVTSWTNREGIERFVPEPNI